MPRKLTYEYVKQVFEDRGCVLLSKEYVNTVAKLDYKCFCGNVTTTRFTNFQRGHKCVNCRSIAAANSRRLTLEEVARIFNEGGCTLLSTEYEGSIYPLKYECNCGRESKILLGNFQKGSRCFDCGLDKLRGANNYQWNPDKPENNRNTPEYKKWRSDVLARDEHTCLKCGDIHWGMVAHHVVNFKDEIALRYDVDNGAALCRKCHNDFHVQYGFHNVDGTQFLEFITGECDRDPWFAGEIFE